MSFNKKQVESFFKRTGFQLEKGRETMDALRSRFNKIKRELAADGRFEKVDETLIETLVMAVEIRDRAFMTIIEEGILMFIDKRKKVKQKNHAISTFYQMARTIQDISKKLGMSPLDRMELKIEQEEDDGMKD
jgi:P27 family predicted phage terminase small subunit